jgi:hypothetical protein
MEFSRIRLNKLALSSEKDCINVLLEVFLQEIPSELDQTTEENMQSNLPGYVAFNLYQTYTPQRTAAPSCLNRILCLTDNHIFKHPRYKSAQKITTSLSSQAERGPRQCPDDFSPNAENVADFIPKFEHSMSIIPRPELTVGTLNISWCENMLRLSTKCYVKGIHPQCVGVVVIRDIASADDRLATDVRSASRGMDTIGRHEVLRGLSVGTDPILVRYRVSFSIISSLAGVSTARGSPELTCAKGVIHHVSRIRCSSRLNILATERCRPG